MMRTSGYTLRQYAGVFLLDLPGFLLRLVGSGNWTGIGNRHEQLQKSPDKAGVCCPGEWSSDLHACQVFPLLGRLLMSKALREWPVRLTPEESGHRGKPDVSFIIPFRGSARLPLLKIVLASILGQRGVRVECIVVEQSERSEATGLPEGVRYLHLPHPTDPAGWHKSWAFNEGVREAAADIVVCHDADIVIPGDYGSEIVRHICTDGHEVIHLQRFLFCLSQADTNCVITAGQIPRTATPERVRQNWQGGTLAISREAFWRIGGYDESFVGWGGEDNEFYDRCSTLSGWRYGYLPFIHLWHEPQSGKVSPERAKNLDRLQQSLEETPGRRITRLTGKVPPDCEQ